MRTLDHSGTGMLEVFRRMVICSLMLIDVDMDRQQRLLVPVALSNVELSVVVS